VHPILGTPVNSVLGAMGHVTVVTGGHISYVRGVALALWWGRKVLLDNSLAVGYKVAALRKRGLVDE
jgi:hypothetical protein